MVRSTSRKVFNICNITFLTLLGITFLVPYVMVVSASFTAKGEFLRYGYSMIPRGFTVENYIELFQDATILRSLGNSVFVTVVGTLLHVSVTTLASYALSKPNLVGKGILMKLLIFCMLFSGGLVPTYLLITEMGLKNSYLALFLPGMLSPWNAIILRSNFMAVSPSLEEAMKIDGGNNFTVFWHIALPMCLPTIACVTMGTIVSFWNSWSGFLLYFDSRHRDMYSITAILQEMLQENTNPSGGSVGAGYSETFQMATVVVATLPIIAIFPFMQRYFISGMMLGGVKE